jgi:transcriptional regulator with XRE-family HTH domain
METELPVEMPAPAPISPRSRLYRLTPVGLGTNVVESLTSYVARLAGAHQLRVGILLRLLGPMIFAARHVGVRPLEEVFNRAETVNGPSTMAESWVSAFEKATLRTDLASLTLLPWAGKVSTVHLLGKSVRHCPDCLVAMVEDGVVYEPLVWTMRLFSSCPIHDRKLIERCPACEATQPAIAHGARVGMCRRCDTWLGQVNPPEPPTAWERFTSVGLGELVARPPADERLSGTFGEAIELAIAALRSSGKQLARDTGISQATISTHRRDLALPSVETALRICALGGWSLRELLLGRLESMSIPMPPDQPIWNVGRKVDWPTIDRELVAATSPNSRPESMEEFCRRVGLDRKWLRARRPIAAAALVDQVKARAEDRARDRLVEASAAIAKIVAELDQSGVEPSRRQVERRLAKPLSLREPKLQAVWKAETQG